jgi:hypothetical protein
MYGFVILHMCFFFYYLAFFHSGPDLPVPLFAFCAVVLDSSTVFVAGGQPERKERKNE